MLTEYWGRGGPDGRVARVRPEVHLRTGHEGPEGQKTYSSTLSLTLLLHEGG
jgi:hypothetical protein